VFNAFYEEFARHFVLKFFDHLFGPLAGQVFEKLTQMSVALMAGLVVVVFLYQYLKRQLALPLEAQSDFQVSDIPYCISRALLDKKGEALELYRTTYFLQVGKASQTGEVLRRVQARIFGFGEPVLTEIKDEGTGAKGGSTRRMDFCAIRFGRVQNSVRFDAGQ
jgi:hypothetical protein